MDELENNISEEPPKNDEVNTYDTLPLLPCEQIEPTQCFNIIKNNKRSKTMHNTCKFLCIGALLLTLVFSATEMLEFIKKDLGAEDMLIRRIFGYSALKDKESKSFGDMILGQAFFNFYTKDQNEEPNIPSETTPSLKPDIPSEDEYETSSPPIVEPPPSLPPSDNEDLIKYPIVTMDMSLLHYGETYIYNDTKLSPKVDLLLKSELTDRYNEASSDPLVLVIHTHATESFMPEGATHYVDEGELARSHDENLNMISVGEVFVRTLEENGIPTLHCKILHDAESYRLSYEKSEESIRRYLEEYPSIQYVFDIHRDSIMRSNGDLVSAVSWQGDGALAQVMAVVGSGHDHFEENLAFALQLRKKLNAQYVNLCRPVCLRESTYNQELSPASLLLEMGTSGNTLEEAKASAIVVAMAIADIIKQ